MDRKLTIYFTSDIHGYFAPTDYANNCRAASGLANCAANFTHDRNTLILDGGDTLYLLALQPDGGKKSHPGKAHESGGLRLLHPWKP